MAQNQLIIVLGMHRSGTSLTARILSLLGVEFGHNLLAGRDDNPDGYFEHKDILACHKRIEALIERESFTATGLLPFPEGWQEWDEVKTVGNELLSLVAREIERSGGRPWGFKDPRTMRLLPLWRDLARQLGVVPTYVLALRDPAAVALSLQKRNGFSQEQSELLWALHAADMIRDTGGEVAAVVEYESWFTEPLELAKRTAAALTLPEPNQEDLNAELQSIVHADWNHSRSRPLPRLSPLITGLYEVLKRLGDDRDARASARGLAEQVLQGEALFMPWSVGIKPESSLVSELVRVGRRLGRVEFMLEDSERRRQRIRAKAQEQVEQVTGALEATGSEAAGLSQDLVWARTELEATRSELADRERRLSGAKKLCATLDKRLQSAVAEQEKLQRVLRSFERKHQALTAEESRQRQRNRDLQGELGRVRQWAAKLEAEVEAMRSSPLWRITAPLRRRTNIML